mmetsp:Transcript_2851/g.6994  ORF Transcript_2851/g.6994 Transcript_2851/m.6994 type:complete len:757 (+) Transcript_2851:101-2371(+)
MAMLHAMLSQNRMDSAVPVMRRGGEHNWGSERQLVSDADQKEQNRLQRRLSVARVLPMDMEEVAQQAEKIQLGHVTWYQHLLGLVWVEHGSKRTTTMIHPNSPFSKFWNVLQVLLLLYIAFGAPVRIAWEAEIDCSFGIHAFDLFLDLYFILDILVTFVTASQISATELDDNPKSIALGYVKSGGLCFDLIVSFPVAWFQLFTVGLCEDHASSELLILKLPRMLRLARLLRVVKMVKIFKHPMLRRANPFVIRMWKLGMSMLLVLHLAACGWWGVKVLDVQLEDWLERQNLTGSGIASKYIASLYYAAATLTTVGYGDIKGENDAERIFSLVAMLIGAVIFATVISSVSSLVASSSAADNQLQSKVSSIRSVVDFWKVPDGLSSKILDYYYHNFSDQSMLQNDVILSELPGSLRDELSLHMARLALGNVDIFKDAPDEYVMGVFLSLTAIRASPGETVVTATSFGSEMYIIMKGRMLVMSEAGEVISTLGEGDVFGEVSLITSQRRNASVVAASYCDLYFLRKQDLENANRAFPEMGKRFTELAFARRNSGLEGLAGICEGEVEEHDDDDDEHQHGHGHEHEHEHEPDLQLPEVPTLNSPVVHEDDYYSAHRSYSSSIKSSRLTPPGGFMRRNSSPIMEVDGDSNDVADTLTNIANKGLPSGLSCLALAQVMQALSSLQVAAANQHAQQARLLVAQQQQQRDSRKMLDEVTPRTAKSSTGEGPRLPNSLPDWLLPGSNRRVVVPDAVSEADLQLTR